MRFKKYNARKTVCTSGHTHDSAKEAQRCSELHEMQRRGEISDLSIQSRFELIPRQVFSTMRSEQACSYISDFTYVKDGLFVIEDCKGYKTPEYIIKRKLMKQEYCADGIAIFIET